MNVLITGGAGFIGSHVVDALIEAGHRVRVLDNLSPQVHGEQASPPSYLHPDAEFITGDIRDADAVAGALRGVEAVFHFAACVGVGQSMYRVVEFTQVNQVGTAVLLEALARTRVERLIVASSMSIYGEGMYCDEDGRLYEQARRVPAQTRAGNWEVVDDSGRPLRPVPTPETKAPALASNDALSKYAQERMCLCVGGAMGIPTVALRVFNCYGPRQALSNPYTGVLAIFAARLLNNRSPIVFEDGRQQRDFVSVRDVARACLLALRSPQAPGRAFNIGSGNHFSVVGIARHLADVMDRGHIEPTITGEYRVGDVRHCFADITQARRYLGYEPRVSIEEGIAELAEWLDGQVASDRVVEARQELASRGLTL